MTKSKVVEVRSRAPSKDPHSLKVRLKVVVHGDEYLFYDPASKRAATVLFSGRLPVGTELTLERCGQAIANACVIREGHTGQDGHVEELFVADSIHLLDPDPEVVNNLHSRSNTNAYFSGEIRAERFLPNDWLVLTLQNTTPPALDKNPGWSLDRWFRRATYRTKHVASETVKKDAVCGIILDLFEDAEKEGREVRSGEDFLHEYQRTPWRELLKLAIQEVGIRNPKQISAKEAWTRFTLAASRGHKVHIVLQDGSRIRGEVLNAVAADYSLLYADLSIENEHGQFVRRNITMQDIRWVSVLHPVGIG